MLDEKDIKFLSDKQFPCPLCDRKQEIRISKSDKPYIICDFCGVQLFIRYDEGIELLLEKINRLYPF